MKTIQDLFAYIYSLAQNHRAELYPRYFWQKSKEKSPCNYVLAFGELIDTQCGLTDLGLSAALDISSSSADRKFSWGDLERDEQQIQTNTEFFIYNFALTIGTLFKEDEFGTSTQCNAGHQFKVIAYRNENQEIRYKFLQSFVKKYTLLEFLNKVDSKEIQGDYSQEEFSKFMLELKASVKAKEWNENRKFFKTYFHVECDQYEGHHFIEESTLSIERIKCDLKIANEAQESFIKYKNSIDYPEFIFLMGNEDENQILQNSFGENELINQCDDYCALEHPWQGLIYRQTDAGRLLSSKSKFKIDSSLLLDICCDRKVLSLAFLVVGGAILVGGVSVATAGLIIPAFGATLACVIAAWILTGVGVSTLLGAGFFAGSRNGRAQSESLPNSINPLPL